MSEKLELWDAVKKTKYSRTFEQLHDIISNAKRNIDAAIISTLNVVCTVSHFEAGTFWYYDRSNEGLIRARATYGGADLSNVHLLPGEGVAGKVIQSGKPTIIADAKNDTSWSSKADSSTGFDTRNMICVPLTARDVTFGCIQLVNKEDNSQLDESDEDLVINLAAEISKLCLKYNILIDEKLYQNVAVLSISAKDMAEGSKKVNPETMYLALRDFAKIIEEPIKKHDGVVDKFGYDNILVYWVFDEEMEAKQSQDLQEGNDYVNECVLNACKTAVDIINKKVVLQNEIANKYNIGFGLSAGIAYGSCYMGDIGTKSFANNTIIGHTVDLAKSLRDRADYGQIYVDEASAIEVSNVVSFTKVREGMFKNSKDNIYTISDFKIE